MEHTLRIAAELQRRRSLLIAGLILLGPLTYGFWLAPVLSALAIVVGHLGLPSDRNEMEMHRRLRVFLLGLALRATGVAGLLAAVALTAKKGAARKRQRSGGIQRGKAAADRENKAGV
jgi:hypothetical protein